MIGIARNILDVIVFFLEREMCGPRARLRPAERAFFVASLGITEAAHIADHHEHLKSVVAAKSARLPTQIELDDVSSMFVSRETGMTLIMQSMHETFDKLL